ncbi:MAG TPA: hypothetical protein DCY42_03660 [Chloroflexi bacterium]|nr:hypothetical protein [Chloroflexota bacterium]
MVNWGEVFWSRDGKPTWSLDQGCCGLSLNDEIQTEFILSLLIQIGYVIWLWECNQQAPGMHQEEIRSTWLDLFKNLIWAMY